MTICEVTYMTRSNNYSVNMIWSNTGAEELESIQDTAERFAINYGYSVVSIEEITEKTANANLRKGMSYYSIDEQAELDHDPSMKTETADEDEDDDFYYLIDRARAAAAEIGIDFLNPWYVDTEKEYVDLNSEEDDTRVIWTAAAGIVYAGPDDLSPEELERINRVVNGVGTETADKAQEEPETEDKPEITTISYWSPADVRLACIEQGYYTRGTNDEHNAAVFKWI